MPRRIFAFTIAAVLCLTGTARPAPPALPPAGPPPPRKPALRAELLRLAADDQQLRKALFIGREPSVEDVRRLQAMDRGHTRRMRRLVRHNGWPTRSLVGNDGAEAAWLLVQHADLDRKFQRECLERMRPLVDRHEVEPGSYAYLTDRVLLAEGKQQLYGTQFRQQGDTLEPYPLEDPDHVDERRKSMGLEPLSQYREELRRIYRPAIRK